MVFAYQNIPVSISAHFSLQPGAAANIALAAILHTSLRLHERNQQPNAQPNGQERPGGL